MAKQIYAVYDETAQDIVGGLFVFTHDAPAIRIFVDGLNDPSTMLHKHPDDYSLICLGEFEEVEPDTPLAFRYPRINGDHTRQVLTGRTWRAAKEQEGNA